MTGKSVFSSVEGRWKLFLGVLVLCVLAAGLYVASSPPTYVASEQVYVTTGGANGSVPVEQAYDGGLLSLQKAQSYVQVATAEPVMRAVVEDLGLRETPSQLAMNISATVPLNTSLIDLTVRGGSAQEVTNVARVTGQEFVDFINKMESPPGTLPSPIEAVVVAPAAKPSGPAAPSRNLDIGLGVVLGLVLGMMAVLIRAGTDSRVRTVGDLELVAGLPALCGRQPSSTRRNRLVSQSGGTTAWEAAIAAVWRDQPALLRIAVVGAGGVKQVADKGALAVEAALTDLGFAVVADEGETTAESVSLPEMRTSPEGSEGPVTPSTVTVVEDQVESGKERGRLGEANSRRENVRGPAIVRVLPSILDVAREGEARDWRVLVAASEGQSKRVVADTVAGLARSGHAAFGALFSRQEQRIGALRRH